MSSLRRFWRDQSGATAIEYALIGGFISIVIVVGATQSGTNLNAKLQKVSQGLS